MTCIYSLVICVFICSTIGMMLWLHLLFLFLCWCDVFITHYCCHYYKWYWATLIHCGKCPMSWPQAVTVMTEHCQKWWCADPLFIICDCSDDTDCLLLIHTCYCWWCWATGGCSMAGDDDYWRRYSMTGGCSCFACCVIDVTLFLFSTGGDGLLLTLGLPLFHFCCWCDSEWFVFSSCSINYIGPVCAVVTILFCVLEAHWRSTFTAIHLFLMRQFRSYWLYHLMYFYILYFNYWHSCCALVTWYLRATCIPILFLVGDILGMGIWVLFWSHTQPSVFLELLLARLF